MENKRCAVCTTKKHIAEFGYRKSRSVKTGVDKIHYRSACRPCEKERSKRWRSNYPEKVRASKKKHRLEKSEKVRQTARKCHLKERFGLTVEAYNMMLKEQDYVCKICGKQEISRAKDGCIRRLAVDHCHSSGKIRGLLCCLCNSGLGKFLDNTNLLQKAIKYLEDTR